MEAIGRMNPVNRKHAGTSLAQPHNGGGSVMVRDERIGRGPNIADVRSNRVSRSIESQLPLPVTIAWEIATDALEAAGGLSKFTDGKVLIQRPESAMQEVCISTTERSSDAASADAVLVVRSKSESARIAVRTASPVRSRIRSVGPRRLSEHGIPGTETLLHFDGEPGEAGVPWLRVTFLLHQTGEAELLLAATTLLNTDLCLPGGVYQAPIRTTPAN